MSHDQPDNGVVRTPHSAQMSILVCSTCADTELYETLSAAVAHCTPVHSLVQFKDALQHRPCDLVVLNFDLPEYRAPDLATWLRLLDSEPEVILVSRCADAETVRLIAESRRRYVVRDHHFTPALRGAVAELLRIRRLEQAVEAVQVRLTEANAQLEERNRRLDEFCAMLAHDLRGPLAAMVLRTEFIAERYASTLDSRGAELLRGTVASGQRLVEMVRGMYEFARLGASAAQPEYVDIATLVRQVLDDAHIGDQLEVTISVQAPPVWGMLELLRRVFGNVLSNAVKYGDKAQPRILIGYTGVVERAGVPFGEFFIEDNGRGMAERDLGRIFRMFQRLKTGPDTEDGLGIGLAVVQRAVELHGGEVSVRSELGRGTRVQLQLPLAPGRCAESSKSAALLVRERDHDPNHQRAPECGNATKNSTTQDGELSEQNRSRGNHQIEKICSTESYDNSQLSVWIDGSKGRGEAKREQVGASDSEGKDQLR